MSLVQIARWLWTFATRTCGTLQLLAAMIAATAVRQDRLICPKCQVKFAQRSSLSRHRKRCLINAAPPPRRKACVSCVGSKCRCDLQHPQCGRCGSKGLVCRYEASWRPGNLSESTESATSRTPLSSTSVGTATGISPCASATSSGASPNAISGASLGSLSTAGTTKGAPLQLTEATTYQAMTFTVRVLKTWPAMVGHGSRRPPFIHNLQMSICPSEVLLNCGCHLTLWYEEGCDKVILKRAIQQEMNALLKKARQSDDFEVVCAAQAYCLYAILLLFSDGVERSPSEDQHIILGLRDLALAIATTGLLLKAEKDSTMPAWHDWILISARRRTVLASHEICWAWSVRANCPESLCQEIEVMPTPESKTLWQARGEGEFQQSYQRWLAQWKDGPHTMQELMRIRPEVELSERTQRWLEDVDEVGMMLMSRLSAMRAENQSTRQSNCMEEA